MELGLGLGFRVRAEVGVRAAQEHLDRVGDRVRARDRGKGLGLESGS